MAIFNLSRYQELLAYEESSTKDGIDYFQDPMILELISLEASVEIEVFYSHKDNYFALIRKYLDKIINSYRFRAEFIEIVNEDMKKSRKILNNFEKLSTFQINLELEDFSSVIGGIHENCLAAVEFDCEENRFRDSIQKYFFKIQKYSDE